jgi:hypothetical protein
MKILISTILTILLLIGISAFRHVTTYTTVTDTKIIGVYEFLNWKEADNIHPNYEPCIKEWEMPNCSVAQYCAFDGTCVIESNSIPYKRGFYFISRELIDRTRHYDYNKNKKDMWKNMFTF